MKRLCAIVVLVLAPHIHGVARSEIISVPGDWPTIQIAIEQAETGDTIILAPQTYFEAINLSGKRIAIQSEDPLDPSTVESTIIDGFDLGTVVTLLGSEDAQTVLRGLTIRGGKFGVDANGASATIDRCVIEENETGIFDLGGLLTHSTVRWNENAGIGIYAGVKITVRRTTIRENGFGAVFWFGEFYDSTIESNDSTGLYVGPSASPSDVTIDRCIIRSNFTGILGNAPTVADVRNSIIEGNRDEGMKNLEGVFSNLLVVGNRRAGMFNCDGTIMSCTVAQNVNAGIEASQGDISHVVFWQNGVSIGNSSTPTFSGTFNPLFVAPGGWNTVQNKWIPGNYHLSADSPYIDAGNPSYPAPGDPLRDLDGNQRVAGERIDIGAYEFIQPCEGADFDGDSIADACDGDIDGDGITNSFDPCDFDPPGTIVDAEGRPRADLNQDCSVDLADFRIMQADFAPDAD